MATRKLFFEDTYRFQCDARIVSVGGAPALSKTDTAPRVAVVLDQTVFHPQGGGQPTDVGRIVSRRSGAVFKVTDVRADRETGAILHYGQPEASAELSAFTSGDEVSAEIDEFTRRANARMHSAGHLLDSALSQLGVLKKFSLTPAKGYHFPTGANVEYRGVLPEAERDAVMQQLQQELDRLTGSSTAVEVFLDVPPERVPELCGNDADGGPEQGEEDEHAHGPVRVVRMAGLGCPCGGTHVKAFNEIGRVVITKIKTTPKKQEVKVSYDVK